MTARSTQQGSAGGGIELSHELIGKLAHSEVFDSRGNRWRLGDLWRKRPVVLALVRHFG